jgi:hypothetical protein
MYASLFTLSYYSNFLLSINSKKYINNYYFKTPQLCAGLPASNKIVGLAQQCVGIPIHQKEKITSIRTSSNSEVA